MPFDGRILSGASVLAALVDGGSFVKAAVLIGLTDSGVRRAISLLEIRLGVPLPRMRPLVAVWHSMCSSDAAQVQHATSNSFSLYRVPTRRELFWFGQ